MAMIISHGLHDFEILPRSVAALRGDGPAVAGRTRVTFHSVDAATRFLRDLRHGAIAGPGGPLTQLRALISGDPAGALHVDPDEAVRRGALMLVRGHLVVLRRTRYTARAAAPQPLSEARPELPEPARDKLESLRLVAVLDASWQPIAGITLEITAPDGVPTARTTGRDGAAELGRLPPGTCRATGEFDGATLATCFEVVGVDPGLPPAARDDGEDPRALAERKYALALRRHRVAAGETLTSVAEDYGTTWQKLARFNFGTTDPRAVNRALRNQVGCRRRSGDGANYVFTDDDDPGLLFIPEAWEHTGLRTDNTYTVRLQVPRITPIRRFVFSM
jgi:hypothetical protein